MRVVIRHLASKWIRATCVRRLRGRTLNRAANSSQGRAGSVVQLRRIRAVELAVAVEIELHQIQVGRIVGAAVLEAREIGAVDLAVALRVAEEPVERVRRMGCRHLVTAGDRSNLGVVECGRVNAVGNGPPLLAAVRNVAPRWCRCRSWSTGCSAPTTPGTRFRSSCTTPATPMPSGHRALAQANRSIERIDDAVHHRSLAVIARQPGRLQAAGRIVIRHGVPARVKLLMSVKPEFGSMYWTMYVFAVTPRLASNGLWARPHT